MMAGLGIAACACAPRVAVAADGQTIAFPNGGTVTLHADGSVTGTVTLTDYTWVVENGFYRWTGSTAHMPDGSAFRVACYESYIGDPDHAKYAGPWNGTCPFTATPNGDGTYFVICESSDLPRGPQMHGYGAYDPYPTWPSQRVYYAAWRPVLTGHAVARKQASEAAWL